MLRFEVKAVKSVSVWGCSWVPQWHRARAAVAVPLLVTGEALAGLHWVNGSLSQCWGLVPHASCKKAKSLFCNSKDPSKDVLKEVLEVVICLFFRGFKEVFQMCEVPFSYTYTSAMRTG